MKQTAVEFMVEELDKSIGLTKFVDTCDEDYKQEILGIIYQANKMFEEQIINAFNQSWHDRMNPYKTADKYYNETFKSE